MMIRKLQNYYNNLNSYIFNILILDVTGSSKLYNL